MITHSAVLFYPVGSNNPILITGKRHSDCYNTAHKLGIDHDKNLDIQGFLTDNYIFLDRYEAKHEARKCRQLIHDDEGSRELFSEDIWP